MQEGWRRGLTRASGWCKGAKKRIFLLGRKHPQSNAGWGLAAEEAEPQERVLCAGGTQPHTSQQRALAAKAAKGLRSWGGQGVPRSAWSRAGGAGARRGHSHSRSHVGALPVLGSPLAGPGVKQHGPEGASEQPRWVSSVFCSGHVSGACCTGFVPSPNPAPLALR